jgi:Phosphoribosylaminoimidazole carboxylase (NCAIR synthetase)
VERLEARLPVRPGSRALKVAQDRLLEKGMARALGIGTAEFAAVNGRDELEAAIRITGLPAVLKTTRFGYDGKGQARIATEADIEPALAAMRGAPAILESFVHFDQEVSMIVARDADGGTMAFDLTENEHRHHILHTSTVPSRLGPQAEAEAARIAAAIAAHLDYVGVLAVEFFAVAEGAGHRLLVNEIAPRVHNSGHWTEAACVVSQFEQHIRAVAGLPLVAPARHSDCVMENLIGDDVARLPELAAEAGTLIHLYGKREARAGRKMGHFTRTTPRRG